MNVAATSGASFDLSAAFFSCLTLLAPGAYYSFPLATPTHRRMTPCPSTSTMPNLRRLPKAGTLVPSSHLSSRISTIPPCSPSAVCISGLFPAYPYSRPVDAHHRFIAEECDWGFTRFAELKKLFSKQEGHARPTIEDDAADISVFVRVLEDPTGVLWHNFVK